MAPSSPQPPAVKLGHAFYARPADVVASELIGKILARRWRGREWRARIVETEAYMGPEDLACHSSKGLTKRTQTLFGPPGRAYVYLIYGMYDMFNIVAHRPGGGQAVLVRAAEPLDEWHADLSGPGKLARAFHITRTDNGTDLTGDRLFLLDPAAPPPRILTTPRIGIDYSRHWKDVPLRFIDADSRAVSGKRSTLRKPRVLLGKTEMNNGPPSV